MRLALREAERALEHDDVPIGAVIVHDGEVIAAARNERELRGDPTAHAEVLALREAAARRGTWRLLDTALYVTLEPCAMCAGAIVLGARPAGGLRGRRPEGRRGRKRARRARGAAAEPPAGGRAAACSPARPRICCAHSSLQGDRSAPYLPIRNTMSVDPKAILQRIESTYGPLAEGVPSVAYVYEPGVNGQCLYISPSIERVLGFAQEVWIKDGGLWDRLLHPEDADRVITNEAECARSGEALVQEYRISRADGRVVWIRDEMTVVRGEDGQDDAALLRRLPGRHRPQEDGGRARAARALRLAHRAAEPGSLQRPARARDRAPRPERTRPRSISWTWTASSGSTTASATRPATRSCARSPHASSGCCGRTTRSPASAATSSPCCASPWAACSRPWAWPTGFSARSRSRCGQAAPTSG